MKLNIDQWDKKISPYLGAIHTRAMRISSDCQQIKCLLDALVAVPSFETRALDRIENDIVLLEEITKKITEAMQILQDTKIKYNEKEKLK